MSARLKNVYFYFVLFFSSASTAFSRSQEGIILLFFITTAIWFIYFNPNPKKYIHALIVWLCYSVVVFFIHIVFTPFFIFRHITYITVAFLITTIYKGDLFYKYERAIFYLSVISLFFFLWQNISGNSLLNFARQFSFSDLHRGSNEHYNFIIYTIERTNTGISNRNYGFAFEPGFYSVILSLAILLNLLRTNVDLRFKNNRKFYIMAVALLTTLSTTGYLTLSGVMIYLLFREVKGRTKYIYLIIAISLSVYLFLKLEFLQDKIFNLYQSGQEIDEVIQRAEKLGSSYSGGRFGGFIIGWEDFKKYPLFGRGGVTDLSYGVADEGRVAIINGLAVIMSQYGLFGLILFFIYLKKSSENISNLYKSKAKFAFIIVILIGSFSFSIHDKPIFFTFIFHSVFVGRHIPFSKKKEPLIT